MRLTRRPVGALSGKRSGLAVCAPCRHSSCSPGQDAAAGHRPGAGTAELTTSTSMALLFRSVVLVLALTGACTEASRSPGGPISFSSRLRQLRRPSLYSTSDPPSNLYSAPKPYSSFSSAPRPYSGSFSKFSDFNLPTRRRPDAADNTLQTGNTQSGKTSATSVQTSSGEGQQTNQGEANAVSVQQQSGLEGATQVTNNQGVIQALQEASGGGNGNGQQSSNNQVNIESNQLQQNVEGTLVNVNEGNLGVVVVNTIGPTGAVVDQQMINDRPTGTPSRGSSFCRLACRRPLSGQLYCCDDGTNDSGRRAIHGGQCPEQRLLCLRNKFSVRKCGHDGQCAESDKCCYDTCVQHHICKTPNPAQ